MGLEFRVSIRDFVSIRVRVRVYFRVTVWFQIWARGICSS